MNLKKLRVNAQVTLMISLLELSGNVIGVILAVVFRASTFPIVIHTIIVYSILLPRAFLMNTSHNKTRILEYGWKNVLRNLLGMKQQTQETDENRVSGRTLLYMFIHFYYTFIAYNYVFL